MHGQLDNPAKGQVPVSGALLAMPRHEALGVAEIPGKGRGLVACAELVRGQLLEVAPVIPMTFSDGTERSSVLFNYPFAWEAEPYVEAIALGAISMCNHSATANAWFEPDLANKVIRLFAARRIAAGEEITIDYGPDLWFEAEQ